MVCVHHLWSLRERERERFLMVGSRREVERERRIELWLLHLKADIRMKVIPLLRERERERGRRRGRERGGSERWRR